MKGARPQRLLIGATSGCSPVRMPIRPTPPAMARPSSLWRSEVWTVPAASIQVNEMTASAWLGAFGGVIGSGGARQLATRIAALPTHDGLSAALLLSPIAPCTSKARQPPPQNKSTGSCKHCACRSSTHKVAGNVCAGAVAARGDYASNRKLSVRAGRPPLHTEPIRLRPLEQLVDPQPRLHHDLVL